ncbi:MAG: uridylate kinase [Isosphaeraceae bacterium]
MDRPVVIKVGGSLLGWDALPARLGEFLNGDLETGPPLAGRCVLVAGGGAAADLVRELDAIHGLDQGSSHALALKAMDLTASLLAALLPGSEVVATVAELELALGVRKVPILAPRRYLEETDVRAGDALPASWDVTSDSIAARICRDLGSGRLILLKSASLDGITTIAEAVRAGMVDPYFPVAAASLARVEAVCLRESSLKVHELARDPAPSVHATPREMHPGRVPT